MHRATKKTLHRTGDLHIPHQILLPKLGHSIKPSYTVFTPASYNHLHLALQVLTHSMHKAISTLDHTDPNLERSHFYLYITLASIYTYKIGLSMGKPMGRHPIPIT